ncbi:MAG: DUF2892 domain-containing protein [Gammaproteobacteria bacterium]|nr:DUF2892 domain-containing protein [Gammaproteobacteria bacterium]
MFNINIGKSERMIRGVVGVLFMALAATGVIGAWGWIGVVPLVTAAFGWCPPYSLLGINTNKDAK